MYVFVNTVLVGFFGFAAVYHLVLWWMSRGERLLLAFALLCGLLGALSVTLVDLATVHTVQAAQDALRARVTLGCLFICASVWVMASLSHIRARWYVSTTTAILLTVAVINSVLFQISPTVVGLDTMALPWGEGISVPQLGPPRWW